ncbi:ATP/GTP-binding protein [Streptomyces chattanoogensis]|uniref:ATP/GTP-binding protein n=1 Tax=Streptomyces chattanoogensis TaxID=66876 RepID=UPI003687C22A
MERLPTQPNADSILWEGHKPGDGAIYRRECLNPQSAGSIGVFWAKQAPGTRGADPEVVARQAVSRMRLSGPDIQSPKAGGTYVVGMPMWLHVGTSPTTYGPNRASATSGPVTVTAVARVSSITWTMGDGRSVTCQGPGTQYKPEFGRAPSPNCGHLYTHTSTGRSGRRFTITATSTWQVDWYGAGQRGGFTQIRTSRVRVAVGELQALG